MFSLSCFIRFNAVIPFLIVIVVTFVGMVLSGYYTILYKNSQLPDPEDTNTTYSDSLLQSMITQGFLSIAE